MMFKSLGPTLVNLRKIILSKEKLKSITGNSDKKIQKEFAIELAKTFGYDLKRGQISRAIHSFSSGTWDDVRITTRIDPSDPFNCIYSTIQEIGHASQEQNVQKDFIFSPLGRGVSHGVHESQSRIYENQLG